MQAAIPFIGCALAMTISVGWRRISSRVNATIAHSAVQTSERPRRAIPSAPTCIWATGITATPSIVVACVGVVRAYGSRHKIVTGIPWRTPYAAKGIMRARGPGCHGALVQTITMLRGVSVMMSDTCGSATWCLKPRTRRVGGFFCRLDRADPDSGPVLRLSDTHCVPIWQSTRDRCRTDHCR